jgi:eukaryotic translation initiation factor 2C
MDPNMQHPFNVRSFFTEDGKRAIGGGLELWRGYFQSVRPSQGSMYINLDIATGVMYKPGFLLQLCIEHLNVANGNPGSLSPNARPPFPDRERVRLQRFISGMRITTSYTGSTKTFVIKRVTAEGASGIIFPLRDGGSISVADYFKKHLNYTLKFPHVVCVEVRICIYNLHELGRYLYVTYRRSATLVPRSLWNSALCRLASSCANKFLRIRQTTCWSSQSSIPRTV